MPETMPLTTNLWMPFRTLLTTTTTTKTEVGYKETKNLKLGFPGGAVVKNPPTNAGDTGLSPGPGRSHMPQSN